MVKRIRLLSNGKIDKRQFNGGHTTPGLGGRPFGSKNKMPIGLRGKAAELHMANGGLMPMDFMLACLRSATVAGGSGKDKWEFPVTWEDKKWAAGRLLHCFTPTLTATTLKGSVQVLALPPEALKGLNNEELSVLEKVFGNVAKDITPSNPSLNTLNGNGYDTTGAEAYVEVLGES